ISKPRCSASIASWALSARFGRLTLRWLREDDLMPEIAAPTRAPEPAPAAPRPSPAAPVRRAAPQSPAVSVQPPAVRLMPQSPARSTAVSPRTAEGGEPLPPDIRRTLEERLQTDLSDVRVHTGDDAASAT